MAFSIQYISWPVPSTFTHGVSFLRWRGSRKINPRLIFSHDCILGFKTQKWYCWGVTKLVWCDSVWDLVKTSIVFRLVYWPIPFMYGICTYIWLIHIMVHVGKYTIPMGGMGKINVFGWSIFAAVSSINYIDNSVVVSFFVTFIPIWGRCPIWLCIIIIIIIDHYYYLFVYFL